MAPHDTNTEKEARRHATPLIVMGGLLVLVLVGFLWWISHAVQGPDETIPTAAEGAPATAPAQPAN